VDFVGAVNNFGDTRSGGLAGPMGLFVIVLMSIATVLLIRNMNKRLRRLPDSFPDAEQTQREAEIARLDADLERSAAASARPKVDQDRSEAAGAGVEDEVTGITTDGDETPANRNKDGV
jgi:F0F1-type ATP synthase membrane subunit b/b'